MPGLDYPNLPGITPESMIQDQIMSGLQNMQKKYELQWNEVTKRAGVLGERKTLEMLSDIDFRAKQELLKFQQDADARLADLKKVDALAQLNPSINTTEAKWRMVLGPEAEAVMFPKEKAEKSFANQMGELDILKNRIEGELARYRRIPGHTIRGERLTLHPSTWWSGHKVKVPTTMEIYDPTLPYYDKKGEFVENKAGGYRKATEDERATFGLMRAQLKQIEQAQRELMGQPDIATRVRRAGMGMARKGGGTLGDKIQKDKPQPKPMPTPKLAGPVKFKSPDGTKTYTVSADQVEAFAQHFPDYKRVQ